MKSELVKTKSGLLIISSKTPTETVVKRNTKASERNQKKAMEALTASVKEHADVLSELKDVPNQIAQLMEMFASTNEEEDLNNSDGTAETDPVTLLLQKSNLAGNNLFLENYEFPNNLEYKKVTEMMFDLVKIQTMDKSLQRLMKNL